MSDTANAAPELLQELAQTLTMGEFLARLHELGFKHIAHWQQGEFHHDHVFRVQRRPPEMPGDVLVVSTNCNGGIKEVLCFADVPQRWALWHARCPQNPEFSGELPALLGEVRTCHWFDPHELLTEAARSELRPEHRRRQRGGGWVPLDSDEA